MFKTKRDHVFFFVIVVVFVNNNNRNLFFYFHFNSSNQTITIIIFFLSIFLFVNLIWLNERNEKNTFKCKKQIKDQIHNAKETTKLTLCLDFYLEKKKRKLVYENIYKNASEKKEKIKLICILCASACCFRSTRNVKCKRRRLVNSNWTQQIDNRIYLCFFKLVKMLGRFFLFIYLISSIIRAHFIKAQWLNIFLNYLSDKWMGNEIRSDDLFTCCCVELKKNTYNLLIFLIFYTCGLFW